MLIIEYNTKIAVPNKNATYPVLEVVVTTNAKAIIDTRLNHIFAIADSNLYTANKHIGISIESVALRLFVL